MTIIKEPILGSIQVELLTILPKELLGGSCTDHWQYLQRNIKNGVYSPRYELNGVPYTFTRYLSDKYGYKIETLMSKEFQSYMFSIALQLYNNQNKNSNNFIPAKSPLNSTYIRKKESRKDILKEIPIAKFDN